MLPITYSRLNSNIGAGGRRLIPEYFRRIFHYPQMDIEYTFWIMFYLCFNPSRVYRNTSWHKQTKNQWARDDPAFVFILLLFMFVASMSYAITFHYLNFFHIIKTIFWSVFIDFILVGLIVATIGWYITNRFFRVSAHNHSVDQSVEWLYAFDIHCNSFFPFFIILYVFQFFLLPILLSNSFLSTLISNVMYFFGFVYYYHITFLGYNALPFLQHTVAFLYPIALIFTFCVLGVVFNINLTVVIMKFYFGIALS
ncbi:UNC-50 family protein [Tieghemostelium lacteum]|uniref:UNC-50 family protein n=1 Tax=Tieghemostelium lacteum TaxID=361077 RepID=A0A152A7V5_TIELA|nr:UNC-50 family protein [Tieghemostelium lacteum]|eukprot:KYR02296.1 UNC-50 family protein [Tieghemostelium lacteum]